MELFLALSQGIGLSLATGVRPLLPPLVAGAFARADLGVDFEGTDFSFLESTPFLVGVLAFAVIVIVAQRRADQRWLAPVLLVAAIAIGASVFAGTLADEGYAAGIGAAAGATCALLGRLATTTFMARAGSRLQARGETDAASFMSVYADAAALVLAVIAIAVPPLALVALGFCAFVLVVNRRRAGRKYEGLRVLR
jgi:hypothetical protein